MRVGSVGCSCLPELVSTVRCNNASWSEILFAWASPLPESEARLCLGKSLKERDTSFAALPRIMSVEGAASCPGRRAGAVCHLVWKRLRSGKALAGTMAGGNKSVTRSQCRDGSLAAKETGENEYGRSPAPLLGRSVGKKHACPEPLGPRRQQLWPPVSSGDMGLPTGAYPELAETTP